MKTEFIATSWLGLIAIFGAGFMLCDAFYSWRAGSDGVAGALFVAIVMLELARRDAKQAFDGGRYERDYLCWRRQGPSEQTQTLTSD